MEIFNWKFWLLLKAPEGETQPSTDVDLFISTEKIMVLNTDLKVCYLCLNYQIVSNYWNTKNNYYSTISFQFLN